MKKPLLAVVLATVMQACGGGGGGGSNAAGNDSCGAIGLGARSLMRVVNGTACANLERSPIVRVITAFRSGAVETCTGTMLTPRVVLTAWHCTANVTNLADRTAAIYVAAGEVGGGEVRTVTGTFLPPGIRVEQAGGELNIFNDVAILALDKPLNLPVLPILLSTAPSVGSVAQVYGYGQSKSGPPSAPKTVEEAVESIRELRSGEMVITSVTNNHIRAEYINGSSMICRGDSGGPLVFVHNGEPTIVGVASQLPRPQDVECGPRAVAAWTRLQSTEILEALLATVPDALRR